jgi:hypothetical protein
MSQKAEMIRLRFPELEVFEYILLVIKCTTVRANQPSEPFETQANMSSLSAPFHSLPSSSKDAKFKK